MLYTKSKEMLNAALPQYSDLTWWDNRIRSQLSATILYCRRNKYISLIITLIKCLIKGN